MIFAPRIIASFNKLITVRPSARLFIGLRYDVGSPRGFLVWRFNGSVISSRTDPRVTVLEGGGLTIRNISSSDAGQYNVTVANGLGSESRLFTVFVSGRYCVSILDVCTCRFLCSEIFIP